MEMCRDVGIVTFMERDEHTITICVNGINENYEILKVVKFTSERKRMSVIARRQNDGRIFNFLKGADDVIIPRLTNIESDAVQKSIETINTYSS